MNRMEQVMRDLPDVYRPFKKFDQLVPPHAKVESWLLGSYPEYVLFGEHLTRKIYTKEESIEGNIKSDYIIFVNKDFPTKKGDIILGEGYYLRKTH